VNILSKTEKFSGHKNHRKKKGKKLQSGKLSEYRRFLLMPDMKLVSLGGLIRRTIIHGKTHLDALFDEVSH
jgi:hypothetical protein